MFMAVAAAAVLLTGCGKGEFTYEKVENGVSVTGYNGESTDVIIPEKLGGKTVVSIGEGAFDGSVITSVVIPDTVQTVEKYAFRRCYSCTIPQPY